MFAVYNCWLVLAVLLAVDTLLLMLLNVFLFIPPAIGYWYYCLIEVSINVFSDMYIGLLLYELIMLYVGVFICGWVYG